MIPNYEIDTPFSDYVELNVSIDIEIGDVSISYSGDIASDDSYVVSGSYGALNIPFTGDGELSLNTPVPIMLGNGLGTMGVIANIDAVSGEVTVVFAASIGPVTASVDAVDAITAPGDAVVWWYTTVHGGFQQWTDNIIENFRSTLGNQQCFTAGTQITMWDGTTKNIEDITPDDIVKSYDDAGTLVPGRVTQTFQNIAKHILNVHGLEVTPGHATLCGEGAFAGQHVPIIDIIRSDGAIVKEDGTMVRINTNCTVGSYEDQFVLLAIGEMGTDGLTLRDQGRVRIGSRFILPDGRDMSIAEILTASDATVNADGLVVSKSMPEPTPLHLSFLEVMPKIEGYILARSGVTLAAIYQAGEWEDAAPQMPAPFKPMYARKEDIPREEILKAEANYKRPQRLN